MINKLVRKQIKNIPEVNWGDVPDNTPLRLLWGENSQSPDVVISAITKEAKNVNRYPSPTKEKLRKLLANYNNVDLSNIVVTNGSDEAIELVAKVFISEGDEAIIPAPTFPVYNSVSLMMGANVVTLPLEKDFSLDTKKLADLVNARTKLVWIANPNNPTGNILISPDEIEALASKYNCLFIIDECYFELSQVTAAILVDKYPNIIVIRSFSKVFGLAGARLGYIIANKFVTKYLNRLQQANQVFNVNRFAQAAGIAILEDNTLVGNLIKGYVKTKENFERLLADINDIELVATKTTFCLLNLAKTKLNASETKKKLGEKSIYVKDCYMYQLLGPQYLYLGVPAQEYQKYIVETLQNILIQE
jgi:histidinol-phosphate aminotransferase